MVVLCIFLVFLLSPVSVTAQVNQQNIVSTDSPLYEYIEAVYIAEGFAPPSESRPWTQEEFRRYIRNIRPHISSDSSHALVETLESELATNSLFQFSDDDNSHVVSWFRFNTEAEAAIEGFWHENLHNSENYTQGTYDWIHGYEERKELINLPLELWVGPILYMHSSLTLREEYNTISLTQSQASQLPEAAAEVEQNNWNLPNIALPKLDLYFPFRAFLSLGGPHWNVSFGRDRLDWGNGNTGNLVLSDYSHWFDFGRLRLYWPFFSFDTVYGVMDHWLGDGTNIEYKAYLGRRLEFTLFDRLLFSITESMAFGNQEPLLFRDLNPLMIFHNWSDPDRCNSSIAIDLSVTPIRFIEVYAQAVMDEFMTSYESDRDGGGGPGVFGVLGGLEFYYPIGAGYLRSYFEGAYTDPWLYNRRATPLFTNVRRYWSFVTNSFEYVVKPLGYEYSPDTILLEGHVSYTRPAMYSFAFAAASLWKGEQVLESEYTPSTDISTPSGNVEHSLIFHLSAEASINTITGLLLHTDIPLLNHISIGSNIYYRLRTNLHHIPDAASADLETSFYIQRAVNN
ncbi:MAG: hypothetical protein ACLFR1_08615 [Spirochaetia bacterium]